MISRRPGAGCRLRVLERPLTFSLLAGCLWGLGLGGCDEEPPTRPAPVENETKASDGPGVDEGPVAEKNVAAPWSQAFKHYDLVDLLGLASLHDGSLGIDFGTSDCFKYTLGGWRTGWGEQRRDGDVTYANAVSTSSRVYSQLDAPATLDVQFRLKRAGASFFSLYVNNKPVRKIDITRAGWATYSAQIPGQLLVGGVNHMLLRWNKTSRAQQEDVAAHVDSIRLATEESAKSETKPPHQSAWLAQVGNSPALSLAGGHKLTYWLHVPSGQPRLGFYLGLDSRARAPDTPKMWLDVRAFVDGADAALLFSQQVVDRAPDDLRPTQVNLAPVSGQVARLDISVRGAQAPSARVVLADPGVYVTRAEPKQAVSSRDSLRAAGNAIVVMIDTLRADRLESYAKTRVKAPVLDRFCREGAVFERFNAVEDWTKPSCATMLTGLYPETHKTQSDSGKLPASVKMISEELQAQGLRTGAFVANGYVSHKFGFKRGWDHFTNYIRENKKTEAQYVFADAAAWIAKRKANNERFFAYVHTIDPHVPYDPPAEFLELYQPQRYVGRVRPRGTAQLLEDIKRRKFKPRAEDKHYLRALYDGEISYHDKWFGDFLAKLDGLGLAQETLIIVVSDHGEEFWEHGSVGHGHQIHQELIRVPFVMRWPGTISPGMRVPDNHDHACLAPTVLDALGLKLPRYLEGRSVLARALGVQEPGPHAGFATHQGEREAVWSGRFKLLMRGPVVTSLFDVEQDPDCKQDLDTASPITLTYMRALLGMFKGARDKKAWRRRALGRRVVDPKAEKVTIDEETSEQLKALGYFR